MIYKGRLYQIRIYENQSAIYLPWQYLQIAYGRVHDERYGGKNGSQR